MCIRDSLHPYRAALLAVAGNGSGIGHRGYRPLHGTGKPVDEHRGTLADIECVGIGIGKHEINGQDVYKRQVSQRMSAETFMPGLSSP